MNIIAAICKNRGIGFQNKLPWKLENEMQNFKKLTIGKGKNAVVMGKNTWVSLKNKPLKNRDNIILSNTMKSPEFENSYVLNNEADVFEWTTRFNYNKIWIIGGETIYNRFIYSDYVDKIYLTEIDKDYQCDTFFPEIPDNFKDTDKTQYFEENGIKYNFKIYKNLNYNIYKWKTLELNVERLPWIKIPTKTYSIKGHNKDCQ